MNAVIQPTGGASIPPLSNTEAEAAITRALLSVATPIVITGAGGWLGQSMLALLDRALSESDFVRRVHAFGSDNRTQALPSGRTIEVRRLAHLAEVTLGPAHYFHFAFLTKDRLQSIDQAAFVDANKAIGDHIEAAVARNGLAGLFVPSSGAVYRRGTRLLERDVDANPYGALKLVDEDRFGALAERHGAPACMPRVFNLAGPFINKTNIYALATIITDVRADRAVEIRAAHPVVRSYMHVDDLLRLAVAMLFDPRSPAVPVFDTAGDRAIELGDLADCVRRVLGRFPDIVRPAFRPDGQTDQYVGDRSLMMTHAERYGLAFRDLEVQIRDTAAYLATLQP